MFLDIEKRPESAVAFLDDAGVRVLYGELVSACSVFARILPERELVFCLCKNCSASVAGYIALYESGSVPLLLGADNDEGLLERLVEIYQPSYFWLPCDMANRFPGRVSHVWHNYALIRRDVQPPVLHEDLSMLLTTSGSTGSPKLVRHKYGNVEANARNVRDVFGWSHEERGICHLPMQYTMGLNAMNTLIAAGATVLLVSAPLTSSEFWQFIRDEEGTSLTGVPYTYEILQKLRFSKMSLPHLVTIASGGGKLSENTFKYLTEYAYNNNKRFFATFGTTETSARMAYLSPDMAIRKIGSIGKAIPEGRLFLVDTDGMEIEYLEAEGELGYQGPNVTMGYAACRDDLRLGDDFCGEYRTGDIARRDNEGYYYIVGRRGRFLKLFGLRVSFDECEKLLGDRFGIDCACTGDDTMLDIHLREAEFTVEVLVYLSKKTGLPKSVMNVVIIPEIPRNEFGKIRHADLKKV